jgi:hypothetical protein
VPEVFGQNPALINTGFDRPEEAVNRLEDRVRKVFQLTHGTASGRYCISPDVFYAVEVSACDIWLEKRDPVIVLGRKVVWCDEHLFFSLLLIGVMRGNLVRPTMEGRTR